MYLSIVIPAFNESCCIAETLVTIHNAVQDSSVTTYEIIVADDDSTDNTPQIAKSMNAQVVRSGKRNIAASRNAGAAQAKGDCILFVDADTLINPRSIQELKQAIDKGFTGGGTTLRWSESASWWADIGMKIWNSISRWRKLPAGSFFFVKREIFEAVGGFDEEYFVSEELHLARKLKQFGKLKILSAPITTSPRKIHQFSLREHLHFFAKAVLNPFTIVRDRRFLDIWYERRN